MLEASGAAYAEQEAANQGGLGLGASALAGLRRRRR